MSRFKKAIVGLFAAGALALGVTAAPVVVPQTAPTASATVISLTNSKVSDVTAIVWKKKNCLGTSAHVKRGDKSPFMLNRSVWKPKDTKLTLNGVYQWRAKNKGQCINLPFVPIGTIRLDK